MPTMPAAARQVVLNSPLGVGLVINSTAIRGIFDNTYLESLDITGTRPAVLCDADQLALITPAVARGTTVTIGSATYTIQNIQPENTGYTLLVLSAN